VSGSKYFAEKLPHAGIGGDILYYLTWQSQPGMQFGQQARLLANHSLEVRSWQMLENMR
jgi:hypothetical protein